VWASLLRRSDCGSHTDTSSAARVSGCVSSHSSVDPKRAQPSLTAGHTTVHPVSDHQSRVGQCLPPRTAATAQHAFDPFANMGGGYRGCGANPEMVSMACSGTGRAGPSLAVWGLLGATISVMLLGGTLVLVWIKRTGLYCRVYTQTTSGCPLLITTSPQRGFSSPFHNCTGGSAPDTEAVVCAA